MKNVVLALGSIHGLSDRKLEIWDVTSPKTRDLVTSTTLTGTATYADVALDDDRLFLAELTDYIGGVALVPTVIRFSTSSSITHGSGPLSVVGWEDLSESSCSMSTSTSTSQSTSSSPSLSLTSQSTTSTSLTSSTNSTASSASTVNSSSSSESTLNSSSSSSPSTSNSASSSTSQSSGSSSTQSLQS